MRPAALLTAVVACASCAHPATPAPDAAAGRATPSSERAAVPSAAPRTRPLVAPSFVAIPGGSGGVGFDDLRFAAGLRRVLVPAAGTGLLALIDPDTFAVTTIGGFSRVAGPYTGGHDDGPTSTAEGRGWLFVTDRTARELDVVDPRAAAIVARAKLGAGPDYVRWVETTGEVWVTEPDRDRIEIFALPKDGPPTPARSGEIAVPGGPESLRIDTTRNRAFTHLWKGTTLAIDLAKRAIVARWPNGCAGSRGIALDAARGLLMAGCAEGKLSVLDVDHGGKLVGSVDVGAGVDVIAYDPKRAHAYVPGARSATMAIAAVATSGAPTVLATVPTAAGAHCVTADDRGAAWVCDPRAGRLLRIVDSAP